MNLGLLPAIARLPELPSKYCAVAGRPFFEPVQGRARSPGWMSGQPLELGRNRSGSF
jgi:hypothetical protein